MKPTGSELCAMTVQLAALAVMFGLSWKYDGNLTYITVLAGAFLCGLNLRKYLPQQPKTL
jgi:hypothetical protein